MIAAALAAALALTAYAPAPVLALAVLLAQGLLAGRWFAALGAPGTAGGALVGAAAALLADVLVVVRDDHRPLAPVAAVLAAAMLGSLVQQLARRDGRSGVIASIAATTTLAVVAVLGTGYLGARLSQGGSPLVVVAALAAGAVTVLDAVLLWLPQLARLSAGFTAAVLLGLVTGMLSGVGAGPAVVVALGCAATAASAVVLTRRVAHPDPFVSAALPLMLAGPVGYLLGRLLVG
jgi:hypothetical protein